MCVIIHREPGIEIPFDKLRSACTVNSDGMGLIIHDRGQIELRRVYDPKGNDPDKLAKLLEDAKDHDIYVHLRYKTKGATDLKNVHPFTVLKQKKHGMDIQFMHNGTLPDFGNQADCDSKDFAQAILQPLFQKLIPGVGEENLLNDPTVAAILNEYAGRASVFLLADNFGNHLIINKDNGYEQKGWWASNQYSFDVSHRSYTKNEYTKDWVQTDTKKAVSLASVPAPKPMDKGRTSDVAFNDEIPFAMGSPVASSQKASAIPDRQTFCEVAGIESLNEMCSLSYQHVEDLVQDNPEYAVLLIVDLLAELYERDHNDMMEYAA